MAATQAQEHDDFTPEPRSLDLHDYWLIVRRRWRLIVVLGVVGALAGAGYSAYKGPTYTATSQVVVSPVTQGPLNQSVQVSGQVNMSTEQAIAQSGPVIQQAAAQLGVPVAKLDSEAGKRLAVSVPASTLTTSNVLQISWEADTPVLAQRGADAFASAYLAFRQHQLSNQIAILQATLSKQTKVLSQQVSQLSAQLSRTSDTSNRRILNLRLNQLSNENNNALSQLATLATYNTAGGTVILAVQPTKPSGFGRSLLAALGLILGLLIGLAAAFGRDLFDDRLRTPAQFEQCLGAAALAELPAIDGAGGDRARRSGGKPQPLPQITLAALPGGAAAEAAREMRATLVAVASRYQMRTLLVVPADASMSADWVVAELAVAIAESGRRVLTVGSDLRGSMLSQIFDVPDNVGLSELLIKGGDPEMLTRRPRTASGAVLPDAVSERLSVLPSGGRTLYALSILDSGRMRDILAGQREGHDFVLLDAPPANGADLVSLAAHVDGVIVLARRGHTLTRDIEALRHRLEQIGAPIVGGVLIARGAGRHSRRPAPRPDAAPAGRRAAPVPAAKTRPMPAVPGEPARSSATGGTLKQPQ
jgi:polysaccharide biosynthesis transport protein